MRNAPGKLFVAGLIAIMPGIGQCADKIQVCAQPASTMSRRSSCSRPKHSPHRCSQPRAVTVEWRSGPGRSGCRGTCRTYQAVNVGFHGYHDASYVSTPARWPTRKLIRGSEIVVMFDRVEHATKRSSQAAAKHVPAHVMTHEITHIPPGRAAAFRIRRDEGSMDLE